MDGFFIILWEVLICWEWT